MELAHDEPALRRWGSTVATVEATPILILDLTKQK
jgi:hypothetical protein